MSPLSEPVSDPTADLATRRRRAIYRANYRGTKEMDWLLGKFAEAHLPAMIEPALSHFEVFLTLPDPDLNVWILDPARITAPEFAQLVDDIRLFHKIDGHLGQPMTGGER
jgi:antitoxin CptB